MPSAAVTGIDPRPPAPGAICPSARWTAVSWAIRRGQYRAGPGPGCVHLLVARRPRGPRRPPRPRRCGASQAWLARVRGQLPVRHLRNGMGTGTGWSRSRAAHRWARPTWVISCRSVHSGQVGTGRVRSAPSMSWASVAVLPVISSYHRSVLIVDNRWPSGGSVRSRRGPPPATGARGAGQPPQPQARRRSSRRRTGPARLSLRDCPPADGHGREQLHGVVVLLGQVQGSDACAIGRLTSKVSPHARHRNS